MRVAVRVARHPRVGRPAEPADEDLDPVARGPDAIGVHVAPDVGQLLAEPLPAPLVLHARRVEVLRPRAPTASPSVRRPPDSPCTDAACFASMAVERSGPIAIIVASRTREVTAAAPASAANGS